MLYYLIFISAMTLISFQLYGIDKRKAIKDRWRIKESVLLCFGFFGGAIGALLGMKLFRHKTKHWYFWAVNFLGLALIIALGIFILIK